MSKICYMLVGLPGCGKSTVSSQLIKEMPYLQVVSTDKYVDDYARQNNVTYSVAYHKLGDSPAKQMKQHLQSLIKESKSFIWDQTNVYASARSKKIKQLIQNGYQVNSIVIELSTEELMKRLKKRESEGGKHIGQKVLNELTDNYTRPTYSEGFSEIYLILNNEPVLVPKGLAPKVE